MAGRMFLPEECVPCVLHHNNRTVEKILQQLLLAMMRYHTGKKALDKAIKELELIVNRDILLRSEQHLNDAGGWHFPLTEKRQLGDINLQNNDARKFVLGFEHLVRFCTAGYGDPEYAENWLDAVQKFRVVAHWLDSRVHFDFEMICQFQNDVDEFCLVYFKLTGRDGMTNYFHLLHAGHYAFFLSKYGNLYRFSQQGWENLNSAVKRSYHHNTQKGGGRGGSSKLLPVMMTAARDILWRYGYLDGLFSHLGHDGKLDIEYGKVKPMPKKHGPNGIKKEVVEEFAKTIMDLAPPELLDEVLYGVLDDALEDILEGSA